jgi:hypothetical protein
MEYMTENYEVDGWEYVDKWHKQLSHLTAVVRQQLVECTGEAEMGHIKYTNSCSHEVVF